MIVIAACWGAGVGAFLWVLEDTKTSISVLEDFRPKVGSRLYSWDGVQLGEFTTEARQVISLNEMPLHLQHAFIATEDKKFYEHFGVRPESIIKAVFDYLRTGDLRGASTITQQVVRNVEPLGVGQERHIHRKVREALVALQVERQFTKDEILELYLNQIFLGVSAYGVEAASHQYFLKSAQDVTIGEAAMLAGLTRSPNRNQPFRSPQNARGRRDIVLGQMLENGFITQTQYEEACATPLNASLVRPEDREALLTKNRGTWNPNKFRAPYFSEAVRMFLLNPPPPHVVPMDAEQLFEEGLEIHTTLDMRLQGAAETTLLAALDQFDANKLELLQKQGREEEFVPVTGALVCLDNRPGYEGFVRALVGGRDFEVNKFNNVTQARRQPGSSVKPFVWAAALDNGYTPSHIVYDTPFRMLDGAGNVWAPQNFDGKFAGPVTLRTALEKSTNIVAVKLTRQLGMPLVRSYLQAAGIRSPIDDGVGLTIALGTPTITVLEQATAYATFATGGVYHAPVMVTEIKDRDGFALYDCKNYLQREQALPADVAYGITYLLEGVAQWGTGARSRALERPRAGKTGTTNENRDVWFCGYTPDFTCVVWIGYRDNRSLGKGTNYTGGRIACPIWTDFMVKAHEGLPAREFPIPPAADIKFYQVDKASGQLGGSFKEVFIRNSRPPEPRPEPKQPVIADDPEQTMMMDLLDEI
jgi:penicillin-binding protein 1A